MIRSISAHLAIHTLVPHTLAAAAAGPARPTLVLVAVLIAVIAGMGAGILLRADGASYPRVVSRGFAAFAACLTLAVLVLSALHLL